MKTVDAEIIVNPADWARQIPRPERLTAEDALTAADVPLSEARAYVKRIAWSYHGTIPPPPWPAHPELTAAMERMQGIARGLEVLVAKNPGGRHETKLHPQFAPKLRAALVDTGIEIWRQLDVLAGRWEDAKARTRNIADAASLLRQKYGGGYDLGTPLSLLTVGVVIGALWYLDRRGRSTNPLGDFLRG